MSVGRPDPPPADEWSATFAAICERHRARLIQWLTAVFGPRDAEDIAQETFVRLYQRPGLLDPAADAWPWLSVVARNVGRDLARRNALSTPVDHDMFAALPDTDTPVSDEVVARDDSVRLAAALRRLTPRERAVIRLRDFDGMSTAEIAELFGSNDNAIRQQLYRARRRLARVYLDMGGDRRLSLPTLLGLRLRELVRRYGEVLAGIAPTSAAMLAAATPVVAVVTGGLFAGGAVPTAFPGTVVSAAAADRDPGHGVARRGGKPFPLPADAPARPLPARLGLPVAPGPRAPVLHERPSVGPVGAEATVHRSPTAKEGGEVAEAEMYVELPNGTRVVITHYEESEPGYGPVCSTGVVQCG